MQNHFSLHSVRCPSSGGTHGSLLAVSSRSRIGCKIFRRKQQLVRGCFPCPDQSSSGSVGGLRSLRKYSALRGAAIL